jgi:hypothetical protein
MLFLPALSQLEATILVVHDTMHGCKKKNLLCCKQCSHALLLLASKAAYASGLPCDQRCNWKFTTSHIQSTGGSLVVAGQMGGYSSGNAVHVQVQVSIQKRLSSKLLELLYTDKNYSTTLTAA